MIHFDITNLENELNTLEKQTTENNFWEDSKNSSKVLKRITEIKNKIEQYKKVDNELQNLKDLTELLKQENDEDLEKDLEKGISILNSSVEKLEISTLLSGKYDSNNAIITLHPGAGGTEAQDWVEMLYRMYSKWANSNGFTIEELDYLPGDEAGIKSVTFLVSGNYAYGYLKGEQGVHRLVRISPFDSNARRHTSFASVDVTPYIVNEDIDIEIKPNDIRIDVYRSTGAGGQGVNTTDSAVRITHLPTKIVVTCQNERSQIQNKEKALEILKNKLYQLEIEKKEKELKELKGEQADINFGSQIRNYVMHPYSLVKDLRTNVETSNVAKVLDGDIDIFINSCLKGIR